MSIIIFSTGKADSAPVHSADTMPTVKQYGECKIAKFWNCPDYHTYKKQYGEHFSEKLAHWAVKMLQPYGQKWTCQEVWDALKSMGVMVKEECKYDVYYMANSLYNDFYPKSTKTPTDVLTMLVDVINDTDGYEEMIFARFLTDYMYKEIEIDWAAVM